MRINTPYFTIKIEPLFLIVFFIFLMSIKIQKMLFYFYACYLFIVFHEISHVFTAAIFDKQIDEFKITMSGVCVILKDNFYSKINKKNSIIKDILIYISGPIGNLLLALIFHNNKLIFEVNMFFCIINLVPIYPLDGYNILKNILKSFNLKNINIEKIMNRISNIFLTLLLIAIFMFCIYLFMLKSKYQKTVRYGIFTGKMGC